MARLLKVKVFNRLAIERWEKAVKDFEFNTGGFPNLCMYTFSTPKGTHRKNGYVVTEGDSHRFYLTKMEVFDNEGLRVHI